MIYRTYKDALFDLTEFKGRLIYDAAGNTFKGKMFQPEYDSLELAIDVLRNLVQKEQKEEG